MFVLLCKPEVAKRRRKADLKLLDRHKSNYQSPWRLFSAEESVKRVF